MSLLHRLRLALLLISTLPVIYLYSYPIFHRCRFPSLAVSASIHQSLHSEVANKHAGRPNHPLAPFRLLVLGDPQLEGDTSLTRFFHENFWTVRSLWSDLSSSQSLLGQVSLLKRGTREILFRQPLARLQAWRKRLDLVGNDYYLAHIYRTLHYFTEPTHVAVLGDLLGSQWIDDEEFDRRGRRFWRRIFRHGLKVEETITQDPTTEVLGEDALWNRRIMNVVGNHDVGYAGDMTEERIERFEKVFGKVNWDITFRLSLEQSGINDTQEAVLPSPELRLVILNSMNMDSPALNADLQSQTFDFINGVIDRSQPVDDLTTGTVVLTHIPLHKEAGVCVDSPFFAFHAAGGVKEQNHLSYGASKGILEGIYGMSGNMDAPGNGLGRNGIILTGHDHEGCDVYHHLPYHEDTTARRWNATNWQYAQGLVDETIPGVREVTVRSMMGDFGGNAGMLSAWFDRDVGQWQFAYGSCSIGVQHIWWTIHVYALLAVGLLVFVLSSIVLGMGTTPERDMTERYEIKDAELRTIKEKRR